MHSFHIFNYTYNKRLVQLLPPSKFCIQIIKPKRRSCVIILSYGTVITVILTNKAGDTLKNFYILTDAINYIEDNLYNEITLEDVAKASYSSLSGLKKLFGYAFHFGLKEYISKRRMTHAAYDLLNCELSVTAIALKYQYNAPEVFTRAFFKVWGTTPSAFKKQWRFTGIFPRLLFEYDGGIIMSRRNVDLSELYDLLKSRTNSYILCFDMINLRGLTIPTGEKPEIRQFWSV